MKDLKHIETPWDNKPSFLATSCTSSAENNSLSEKALQGFKHSNHMFFLVRLRRSWRPPAHRSSSHLKEQSAGSADQTCASTALCMQQHKSLTMVYLFFLHLLCSFFVQQFFGFFTQ